MTELETALHREIQASGPISFARFMDLALYHPEHGYYEREQPTTGRAGDFFTSVGVGPLFGELLAWRFGGWLASSGASELLLVEAGAHDGRLAVDVLSALREQRADIYSRLRYCIVEPSARRREWQAAQLRGFGPQVVWAGSLQQVPWPRADDGAAVVFANELLDAFPVHRLGWDSAARGWFEWGVSTEAGRFVWARLPLEASLASKVLPWLAGGTDWSDPEMATLESSLPDGYVVEISPPAADWWAQAAGALLRGWLVTFDYGFGPGEAVRAERSGGTLRAYRGHRVSDDVLATPGEQDLTAHVNFPAIQVAGEAEGVRTLDWISQERFLTRIAAELPVAWTPERSRQFRTLVHPAQLGRAFHVLIQEKIAPATTGRH